MKKAEYKNRYGDLFTFTKTEDGNILWEGNFEWSRIGRPNVYDDAYAKYTADGGSLKLKDFKKQVHEADYDENGNYLGMSELSQTYGKLVYADINTIDMVDPSGGPYLHSDLNMKHIDKSFRGMIIEKFEPIIKENLIAGYTIIIKK